MVIIGIHVGHNASACLMVDGSVKVAIQEERFTKLKNFQGYPKQSIDYALKYIQDNDLKLDKIVFSTINNVGFWYAYPTAHYYKMKDYVSHYGDAYYGTKIKNGDVSSYYETIINDKDKNKAPLYLPYTDTLNNDELLNDVEKFRKLKVDFASTQCDIDPSKIEFIDHHTCHAYYGYFASNRKNDNCAVITLDSFGDGLNQTIWHFNKEIKRIRASDQCDLARIYKLTTLILGMKPDEHEFKVMGLAPYAKSDYVDIVYKDVYEPILKVEDGRVLHNNRPDDLYIYLKEKLVPYRFDNIAGAVQKLVEEVAIKLIRQAHELTGAKHFCISGGVSMNIKMNMLISKLDFVEQVYVPASGSDESLCMGACYYAEVENSKPLLNTYLGYDITNEVTEDKIKVMFGGKYEVISDVTHDMVADILANENVVAVVRGREEFGARALGNRSIIASPKNPATVKVINEAIKNRDFWMPFALSILSENADNFLDNEKNMNSPYMTIGFETKDENYDLIKAGTHPYDRTCRPQILEKEANPQYHSLISAFYKKTQIPALLNTSLNLHGNPVCSNMQDVLYTFENSGLNYLYIDDKFLIKKV